MFVFPYLSVEFVLVELLKMSANTVVNSVKLLTGLFVVGVDILNL